MYSQELIVAAGYGLTSGRLLATAAALLGLAGVVAGVLARSRFRRRGALVAVSSGVLATVGGAVTLAVADGGPGTGNGVVGAWAAVVLGPVAIALGGLVMSRARARTGGASGEVCPLGLRQRTWPATGSAAVSSPTAVSTVARSSGASTTPSGVRGICLSTRKSPDTTCRAPSAVSTGRNA
jgi:hypothetical protein